MPNSNNLNLMQMLYSFNLCLKIQDIYSSIFVKYLVKFSAKLYQPPVIIVISEENVIKIGDVGRGAVDVVGLVARGFGEDGHGTDRGGEVGHAAGDGGEVGVGGAGGGKVGDGCGRDLGYVDTGT